MTIIARATSNRRRVPASSGLGIRVLQHSTRHIQFTDTVIRFRHPSSAKLLASPMWQDPTDTQRRLRLRTVLA